jgi:hypothetical protein
MKKIVLTLLFVSITSFAFGIVVNNEGEQRVVVALKNIYQTVTSAKNSVSVVYANAKAYVVAHPEQFDAGDRTKLNGLQTNITATATAINNLTDYINTNFPGLND